MKRLGFSVALILLCCGFALGQGQFKVLYTFGGVDGAGPSSLATDNSGNLYGTTTYGGEGCAPYGCGIAFELSPNNDGGWTQTILYNFCQDEACADGMYPTGFAVFDSAGNLYGTTGSGGSFDGGVIFELSPSGPPWTETTLYDFCQELDNCPGGDVPSGSVAFDAKGNLYGTTRYGGSPCTSQGSAGCGTVYQLMPPSAQGGAWTERAIYSFCTHGSGQYSCPDGTFPVGGVTVDKSGNVYGTTVYGGHNPKNCEFRGCGTVFKLTPTSGSWTYSQLYAPSTSAVGESPMAAPTVVSESVYGSFAEGARNDAGAVFGLLPKGGLEEFSLPGGQDGSPRAASIVEDNELYGSSYGATNSSDAGVVFQVTSAGQETVLHSFCSEANCADGIGPLGMVRDKSGNLYGVTYWGGDASCPFSTNGCGVVFEITNPEASSKR